MKLDSRFRERKGVREIAGKCAGVCAGGREDATAKENPRERARELNPWPIGPSFFPGFRVRAWGLKFRV